MQIDKPRHIRIWTSHFLRWTSAVLAGFLFSCTAIAAQFVDVRDGDTPIASISIKDQTRVTLQGGRILKVIGDVWSADKNPTGRLAVVPDSDTGEIYVQFVREDGAAIQARPVKIDIKTDRGRFALLLQPVDIPGDTIIMRSRGVAVPRSMAATNASAAGKLESSENASDPARSDQPAPRSGAFLRAVKAWTLAMALNTAPADVDVRPVNQPVSLWQEASFMLDDEWVGKQWVGDRYTLTNISKSPMVLDEREFWRPGVLAVTVKLQQLQPGTSTAVWILRQRNNNE